MDFGVVCFEMVIWPAFCWFACLFSMCGVPGLCLGADSKIERKRLHCLYDFRGFT